MKRFEMIWKGFIIGSSMSVPGVSGGTMAILLGIYQRLISSISHFFSDVKGNLLFLGKFCLGAVAGIGTLAFAIQWLLDTAPVPVSFFFLGAVIGGVPALYCETKQSKFHWSTLLFALLGLIVVVGLGFLPNGLLEFGAVSGWQSLVLCLVAGVIVAIALVLPGISTSHMLIVLGMYDRTLEAITSFDFVFLITLAVSTLVGVALITKPLEWTMRRFPQKTYSMILGFVVGSLFEIFRDIVLPAVPPSPSVMWWVLSAVMAAVAFILGLWGLQRCQKCRKKNDEYCGVSVMVPSIKK